VSAHSPVAHEGWRLVHQTPPRSLAGANGLRFGPDGGLYCASAFGSEVARIDIDSGELTIVSPQGSPIVSPDDLAFDSVGRLYVAECMNARVTELADGTYRVVEDGVEGANGIAIFEDRIFVTEFIPDGRIFEVFRDDRPRVLLAEHIAGPNGITVGPDRCIYSALPFAGAVARVAIDGGPVEVVAEGLAAPCSCRTGPDGLVHVGLGGSGDVVTIDPATLEVTTVHRTGRPGMDNLDLLPDGRTFVSYYIDGAVYEVGEGGLRELLAPGLMAPYGVAATGGGLCIADGLGAALLSYDGNLERTDKITDPGFPGYVRGLASADGGAAMLVTNNVGMVTKHPAGTWTQPEVWAENLGSGLLGLAPTPDGGILVADGGGGRVLRITAPGTVEELATGLRRPAGVGVLPDGAVAVTDEAAGTLVRLEPDGTRSPLASGLRSPQDLALTASSVLVVEAAGARVVAVPHAGGEPVPLASNLPLGTPDGGTREVLDGLPQMIPGPIVPFAGIDIGPDGRVYVAGDRTGTVVVLEPTT
jgi:DNA-binding beta-propeller fold protein YncE